MAKKQASSNGTVVRISASDTASKKSSKSTATSVKKRDAGKPKQKAPKGGVIGYFVGAWQELRQVHWPTRRATWGLTGAVLAFSAFFVIFILLLDALFKYLFELIIK